MKRFLISLAFVLGLATVFLNAQQPANPNAANIEVLPVQGTVYMLAGAGGNVTLQVGKDGVLMVDSGLAPMAPRILAEIRKLSKGPIRFIINTHLHPDHVGGNESFAKMDPKDPALPLRVLAHENVLNRLTAANPSNTPNPGLPTDEYFMPSKDFFFNGEPIILIHEANAHTDGDSIVVFRSSNVVSTGDIFTPDGYPFLDIAQGGSVQGEIAALNNILQITVPEKTQEGGTYVIPGHGRICDEADVVEYRDMVVIIRDRIQDLIKKGMTLEQVKAAKPSSDYDTQFAPAGSFVKPDAFVEAIYKSITQKAGAK